MSTITLKTPPIRPEAEYALTAAPDHIQARTLPLATRLAQHPALRKALILVVLALLWEVAARWQDNDLLLPTFTQTAKTLVLDVASGELLAKAAISLGILVQGYLLGVLGALLDALFVALANRLVHWEQL